MALAQCTVSGVIQLPDTTIPIYGAKLVFLLSNVEEETEIIAPIRVEATVNTSTGAFSVDLWPNALGTTESAYYVTLERFGATAARPVAPVTIGTIYVPNTATANFSDIAQVLPFSPPAANVLALATASAVAAAASAAAINAKHLSAFGAAGDGVTDDTAAVKAWIEAGGDLHAGDGTYLVAADGADAGGVDATIATSINVTCSAKCVFLADTNLDNDIIRINCDSVGYTDDRNLTVTWTGGKFDQTLQRNSTSMPYSADYPAANLGSSATADGLSIRGEIDVAGTPTAGFKNVTVRDVQILASTTNHWESAGGDQGIFVGGTVHIHISNIQAFGSRDLAIYTSGLSSGAIPGGSCYIGENSFYGCMFGASTKRLMSNVQMVNNIGYNTAVVCTSTDVTSTGDNVLIANNIGYGAWRIVRATGGTGIFAHGNQSFEHGHLLENGSVPATIFNSDNACVHFEGVQKGKASNNHTVGLNTGFSGTVATVLLTEDGATDCAENYVHGNTADGIASVVIEEASNSDTTLAWGNHGKNLTGFPVVLNGASSIDRDGPIYETNLTVAHTGTAATTSVGTATIKQNTMQRRDRIRIMAAGSITGTAGGKTFSLKVGTSVGRIAPIFASTVAGGWVLDAVIEFNTLTSTRLAGTVTANDASGAIFALETQDFSAGDIDIGLYFKLEDTADTMTLNTFSVRFD